MIRMETAHFKFAEGYHGRSQYDLECVIKRVLESKWAKEKIIRFIATVQKSIYDRIQESKDRLAESLMQKRVKLCSW